MRKLGPREICTVLEFLWVPTGRRAKIQSGGSSTFTVSLLVRKLPRGHLRKAWNTLNFIMVLVTDREFHRLSICTLLTPQTSGLYQTLWGLCWLGMYWVMVTFLEGCSSKLHFFFFYEMKLLFFFTHINSYTQAWILTVFSVVICLLGCVRMVGSFRPERSLLWRLQTWEKAQQIFLLPPLCFLLTRVMKPFTFVWFAKQSPKD